MKRIIFLLFITISIAGCKVLDPSIMLRTGENYQFDIPPDTISPEYKLAANDIITFRLFSNDGFKLIDIVSQQQAGQQATAILQYSPSYQIEFDGTVKLPVLGRTKLSEMTIREAELFLEEQYSQFYNKPYVVLTVTNRRVIIFPGQSGSAKVIPLQNDNTTLLEALALAGGLGNDAKANRIKLIRGERNNPEVFLIDLSTIEGMQYGSMVIQSNDIIYVEPRVKVGAEILMEIQPYVQLFTSATTFITAIYTLIVLSKL